MGKTLAEKIFETHLVEMPFPEVWVLRLDSVFCHEITTPIAIDDLVEKGMDSVFDPSRIKAVIDHVSPAKDSKTAEQGKTLRDWARRQGIGDFFDIGRNGVCHALFPEKGIRAAWQHPRDGRQSHLHPRSLRGLCGRRGDDRPRNCRSQRRLRLQETRNHQDRSRWEPPERAFFAKDVILHVISLLGVAGATDRIIEFRGPVVEAMSMEARMTLCNMAVEAGGTSGLCMPDRTTVEYLWPFVGPEGEKLYATKGEALAAFSAWRIATTTRTTPPLSRWIVRPSNPSRTIGYKPDQVAPLAHIVRRQGRPGLYRFLHKRAHRGLEGGRGRPQGAQDLGQCQGHRFARNFCHLRPGIEGRSHRSLPRSRFLRHQPDLRRLSRHVQRRSGLRRSLRLDHEQEFQRKDGKGAG